MRYFIALVFASGCSFAVDPVAVSGTPPGSPPTMTAPSMDTPPPVTALDGGAAADLLPPPPPPPTGDCEKDGCPSGEICVVPKHGAPFCAIPAPVPGGGSE